MRRLKLPTDAAVEYDEEPAPASPPVYARQALPAGASVEFDDEMPANQQPQPEVGKLESFGRGAVQDATFGFGDEIAGVASALFGDKDYAGQRYRKGRDTNRENNKAAQAANPWSYAAGGLAGSVATSFVPGLGLANTGAKLSKVALQAGKIGALSGIGHSEAEDLGGLAKDALASGALSAATGGALSKIVGGAPARAVQRRLGDVTGGATATMRDKVVGKAGERVGDSLEVLREKAFRKAGDSAPKLLAATEDALQETGERFAQAVGNGAPVKVSNALGVVEDIANKLAKDPGKVDLARAVRGHADNILETWGNRTHVTPTEVQRLASDIADSAFRGSPAVAPKQGQAVAQEVWRGLKGLIDESLESTAAGASKEARALGRRMSTLMNMREAVRYRATREATESTRLKDVMGKSADIALLAYDPVTFAGKKGLEYLGKPLARAADDKLADIVTRAAAGEPIAKLKERAIMMGLGPVAAQAMATWAMRAAGQLSGGYDANEAPATP